MHPAVGAGHARDNGVLAMPKVAGMARSYPTNFHTLLFPLAEMAVNLLATALDFPIHLKTYRLFT